MRIAPIRTGMSDLTEALFFMSGIGIGIDRGDLIDIQGKIHIVFHRV